MVRGTCLFVGRFGVPASSPYQKGWTCSVLCVFFQFWPKEGSFGWVFISHHPYLFPIWEMLGVQMEEDGCKAPGRLESPDPPSQERGGLPARLHPRWLPPFHPHDLVWRKHAPKSPNTTYQSVPGEKKREAMPFFPGLFLACLKL